MKLDLIQTLAFGGVVLLLGEGLRRLFPVLARYNLPGPVLGGMTVAVTLAVLKLRGHTPIQFDTTLQSPLMIGFFTSVGFGASLRLLRIGGPQVVLMLVACTGLAVLQNGLGAGLSSAMGLPPLFGVLTGSVTLTGGPGTGLAFAPAFEAAGVPAAAAVAITSAMGGIVLGGVFGGPLATALIERNKLQAIAAVPLPSAGPVEVEVAAPRSDTAQLLLRHVIVILIAIWLGGYVSQLLTATGITLPAYIGAMLVAAVLRNFDDRSRLLRLSPQLLDDLGSLALSLFLALSLMTLKLWELASLALPMVALLIAQCLLMVFAAVAMFRLMGRDYEAAVMSGGLFGFMMGTTANAMANMETLTRRYGPAPRAYLVIPIVGACFIDFTNSVLITACLNLFK